VDLTGSTTPASRAASLSGNPAATGDEAAVRQQLIQALVQQDTPDGRTAAFMQLRGNLLWAGRRCWGGLPGEATG
jgi:hypothetical protein